jgi:hypothetical protein
VNLGRQGIKGRRLGQAGTEQVDGGDNVAADDPAGGVPWSLVRRCPDAMPASRGSVDVLPDRQGDTGDRQCADPGDQDAGE